MSDGVRERLACPFCGSADLKRFDYAHPPGDEDAFVQCMNCGATGPGAWPPERADELWNTRLLIAGEPRPEYRITRVGHPRVK